MNIYEIATKTDVAMIADQLEEIKEMLKSKPKDKEVLRSADVKQLLNISDSTLQRLRISGKLAGQKVNGTWFYNLRDIMSMINK